MAIGWLVNDVLAKKAELEGKGGLSTYQVEQLKTWLSGMANGYEKNAAELEAKFPFKGFSDHDRGCARAYQAALDRVESLQKDGVP